MICEMMSIDPQSEEVVYIDFPSRIITYPALHDESKSCEASDIGDHLLRAIAGKYFPQISIISVLLPGDCSLSLWTVHRWELLVFELGDKRMPDDKQEVDSLKGSEVVFGRIRQLISTRNFHGGNASISISLIAMAIRVPSQSCLLNEMSPTYCTCMLNDFS